MKVPLSVHSVVKNKKEMFNIWYNGQQKVINSPILPYYYAYDKLDVPARITKEEATCLSRYKKRVFYKHSFDTRKQLVDNRTDDCFESNIPFTIRNRLDKPDLFNKFPHTDGIKFLFFDIEQYTKPGQMFPTYDDRITSIAFCTNDRKVKSIYLKKDNTSDKKLLEKFVKVYQEINPDVLVVYNKSYDIPTLLYRCQRNKIDTVTLSKNNERPYIGGKEDFNIEGVIIYDVLASAQADQSLTGNVENRGLKEVSNWFGFKEERKPLTVKQMRDLIGTKELVEYNKDDVKRLLLAFDVYWFNIEFNANDLGIPLNVAIDLNTTDLGLVVVGDEYKKQNIIADGNNSQRYPEIFQRKKKAYEPNYQGALIDITRTGLFKPVYKADFGSMYPSIESTFNLSPDTTTLIEYIPYDGKFKIKEENDYYIYEIPDNVLMKNMVIQVLKKPGFMSDVVKRFLDERAKYKKLWKETDEPKYRAISDNRKLKANGTYGIMGSGKHAFGFVPIAIATTGIGRECVQLLIDVLNELYPNSVLEVDTDGVYYTTNKNNKKDILDLFYKRLKEKFQKELDLSIDIDEYDGGFFYKAKNYVLQKGEKIIYHGTAMKASSKDYLSKTLIQKLAKAKLSCTSTTEIIQQYQKLDFPLKYFVMNVNLGRPLHMYKNLNSLTPRLARIARDKLGVEPEVGTQYYYIKSKNGYRLYELSRREDVDAGYYLDEIDKIIAIFDIKPAQSLDKWL